MLGSKQLGCTLVIAFLLFVEVNSRKIIRDRDDLPDFEHISKLEDLQNFEEKKISYADPQSKPESMLYDNDPEEAVSEFGYQISKKYIYRYNAEVHPHALHGQPSTNQFRSQGDVVITVLGQDEQDGGYLCELKLENFVNFQHQGAKGFVDVRRASPRQGKRYVDALEIPAYFKKLPHGPIVDFMHSSDEGQSVANLKRAILGLLQLRLQNDPEYMNEERDIMGHCTGRYNVSHTPCGNWQKLRRTKYLHECFERAPELPLDAGNNRINGTVNKQHEVHKQQILDVHVHKPTRLIHLVEWHEDVRVNPTNEHGEVEDHMRAPDLDTTKRGNEYWHPSQSHQGGGRGKGALRLIRVEDTKQTDDQYTTSRRLLSHARKLHDIDYNQADLFHGGFETSTEEDKAAKMPEHKLTMEECLSILSTNPKDTASFARLREVLEEGGDDAVAHLRDLLRHGLLDRATQSLISEDGSEGWPLFRAITGVLASDGTWLSQEILFEDLFEDTYSAGIGDPERHNILAVLGHVPCPSVPTLQKLDDLTDHRHTRSARSRFGSQMGLAAELTIGELIHKAGICGTLSHVRHIVQRLEQELLLENSKNHSRSPERIHELLAVLGNGGISPHIVEPFLSHWDPEVRMESIQALRKTPGHRADSLLWEILRSSEEDNFVRLKATNMLIQRNKNDTDTLQVFAEAFVFEPSESARQAIKKHLESHNALYLVEIVRQEIENGEYDGSWGAQHPWGRRLHDANEDGSPGQKRMPKLHRLFLKAMKEPDFPYQKYETWAKQKRHERALGMWGSAIKESEIQE